MMLCVCSPEGREQAKRNKEVAIELLSEEFIITEDTDDITLIEMISRSIGGLRIGSDMWHLVSAGEHSVECDLIIDGAIAMVLLNNKIDPFSSSFEEDLPSESTP